jgi:serine protease Do
MEDHPWQLSENPSDVKSPRTAPRAAVDRHVTLRLTRMLAVLGVLFAILVIPPLVRRIQYASEYGKQRARMDVALAGLKELEIDGLATASRWVAQAVGPSVVHIRTRHQIAAGDAAHDRRNILGRSSRFEVRSEGSGVIVDAEGFIVTNYHVIREAKSIDVELSDGRRQMAEIIGTDPLTDLAVLKIPGGDLAAARWGESQDLEVGDMVWAIGSPFGLDHSVTFGIVSAKGRPGMTPHQQFQDLLQTDAAVNPGNSGGPLVNIRGEVIGINTAIAGGQSDQPPHGYQGVSFAIPSRIAADVYARLRSDGSVQRAFLGVGLVESTSELAKHLGLENATGVLIGSIRGDTPADRAGLQPGDLIVAWNGTAVDNPRSLSRLIAATPIGTTVQVKLIHDGQEKTVDVVVKRRPDKL